MSDEKTSQRVAAIASKAMQNPKSLTPEEIQTLAASALNQLQIRAQGQQKNQSQQAQQAAGAAEEIIPSSVRRSIEITQRAGIVMIPLACALSGLSRSPTLWQSTLTSASSFKSQPTVAHSMARVAGSCERCRQDGMGWALSCQRMMTNGQ